MDRLTVHRAASADAGLGRTVLSLNSGSSSLKFGLYRAGASDPDAVVAGSVDLSASGTASSDVNTSVVLEEALAHVRRRIDEPEFQPPSAVGHRIVHGGPRLLRHCLLDDDVLSRIEAAADLAPLHAQSALLVLRLARECFPHVPHVACFDTVFHAEMPAVARVLPIPKMFVVEGIHRYGFHGLSCESIVRRYGDAVPDRLIVAHLGNGASVTAIRAGRSMDTSMGLTPSGGVIMGSRSGEIDPGVLIYLMRRKGLDAEKIEDLIDRRSGLLGISGVSSDMRILRKISAVNADARLAIEMFCSVVRKHIVAMMAVLGGADRIVLTGGIGENDAAVRAAICDGLEWAGVRFDDARNRPGERIISHRDSSVTVEVLASAEDVQIASHTLSLAAVS